jgi:regulator of RNase E activity RraA
MAARTQRLGVEGVVIDGQLRDIEYIRSLQLPV